MANKRTLKELMKKKKENHEDEEEVDNRRKANSGRSLYALPTIEEGHFCKCHGIIAKIAEGVLRNRRYN